mmetsp:Transcript_27517/g.42962  ORF Transcript_27517/g.42962 Transcript_27517/m.42962 type:complete len:237 (+) Transcript_27517:1295-2005(+)
MARCKRQVGCRELCDESQIKHRAQWLRAQGLRSGTLALRAKARDRQGSIGSRRLSRVEGLRPGSARVDEAETQSVEAEGAQEAEGVGDQGGESLRSQSRKPDELGQFDQGLFGRIGPVAILNLITVLWGSQHAIIKIAVDPETGGTVSSLNLLRFMIAAFVFLPFAPPSTFQTVEGGDIQQVKVGGEKDERLGIWSARAEMGFWRFLGFAMQSAGLQFTTASRNTFLLHLNVKLAP